jgi:starch synthase (maltosyl-transferring)
VIAFSRRVSAEHLPAAGRPGATQDDVILVVINLDPWGTQEATLFLDLAALGLTRPDGVEDQPFFVAHDVLTAATYGWGAHPYVRLDPRVQVAHVVRVGLA